MKILHLVAPALAGGLERVVEALAAGHLARGHAVKVGAVIPPGRGEHEFLTSLEGLGVPAMRIEVGGRDYLHERREVGRLCSSFHPDVVHTHGYRPDVVDAGVARRAGIPVVTTVHGFTGGGWRNRMYERIQRRAFRRFDAVVAVSRPLAERLMSAGIRPDRVHCIPNAWAPRLPGGDRETARRVLGIPVDAFCVGYLGRLSREKGPDTLLEALARLGDLPLTAMIVGDGALRRHLESRAVALGLGRRVRWAGAMPDGGALLPAFDVFVLSSRTEGTPIVLFEAMAVGTPVVATAVGGVPDVVSTRDAILIPPGDSLTMAQAIRAVYLDPMGARERASSARARLAREFGAAPWLKRYETLYGVLAARREA